MNVDSSATPVGTEDEETLVLGRKRRFISKVWEHFELKKIDGKDKAICKYCKKNLGGESKNGTKHLSDHLKSCQKHKNQNIANMFNQKKLKIEEGGLEKGKVVYVGFDQETARRGLANMIIMHEYPLSMVDHIGFRKYSASLQLAFTMISRNALRNDILKIYDHEKSKTMKLLSANRSRVAITTDMWTSQSQKQGFIAITAHWIDESWILQSRIIRFAYVPCPHTAEALSEVLMNCFMDWNLDRKLMTLTVDNCTCNDAIINILMEKLDLRPLPLKGKFFQMRCCAHILNLIVKYGLDVIGDVLEKVRDSVAYWRATPKREERFEDACRQMGLPYAKKLQLDCKTRWNSTFLMLQTALLHKDVFPRPRQRESNYKSVPSDEDWTMAKTICEKLELFYNVTELFSGTQYPTANLYFPKVCDIRLALSEWVWDSNEVIKGMAKNMVKKFDKHWLEIHGIMGIATVLDPRYKLTLLECYFATIYGDGVFDEVDKVKVICYDFLREYESKYKQESGGATTNGVCLSGVTSSFSYTSDFSGTRKSFADIYDEWVENKRKSTITPIKTQLDLYLEEEVIPRVPNFDILNWWNTNGSKWPILAMMARDIYAIPISTVASESAFSTGGKVVTPHRNHLHAKTLEALMCARDWLWATMNGEDSASTTFYHCSSFEDEVEEMK